MQSKRIRLWLAVSALCLNCGAWGEGSDALLKGELHVNSSGIFRTQVILSDLRGSLSVATASVSADGRFEFRNVPYGEYRLTVLDSDEHAIHEEFISVHDQLQPIAVEVTPQEAPRPAAGTVSAQELLQFRDCPL